MTEQEWETIALLLDKGFKDREPFDEGHDFTYRTLLDGYSAEQIANVLRSLVAKGVKFRPRPGEIVAEIRSDPAKPTWPEAHQLIFGRGGVLRARTQIHKASWEAGERDQLDREAMEKRMLDVHPLVAAFIRAQGLERLRSLNLEDPEWGEVRRKQLQSEWERFVEACEDRDVAQLVAGRNGTGLQQFDPLAVLNLSPTRILEGKESA